MKKLIVATAFILTAVAFDSEKANAGLFGTRGRATTKFDGSTCCRYALFNSNCNTQDWLGDCK